MSSMTRQLTQSELEQLTAYLDGELEPAQAAEVEALIASDAAWAQEAEGLASLDSVLDEYVAPAPQADLADRIIAASRRERARTQWTIRLAKYLAPAMAAAAALVLYVTVYHPATSNPPPDVAAVNQNVDGLVAEHLDFFKECKSLDAISSTETVVDDATLKAIDKLETSQGT